MPTAPVPIRYQVFPEPGHVAQVAVSVGESKVQAWSLDCRHMARAANVLLMRC